MTDKEPRPWFGPKRIGWGFGPQTWQGWLIVAVLLAGIGVILSVVGN